MNKVLGLLMLAVVLALVKAVLIALMAALLLALFVSFIRRPGDTLVFLGCLTLLGLAGAQPIACVVSLGVVGVVAVVVGARQKARRSPLLIEGPKTH